MGSLAAPFFPARPLVELESPRVRATAAREPFFLPPWGAAAYVGSMTAADRSGPDDSAGPMASFDPNRAAAPDAGIFGLPQDPAGALVAIVPVPFAATVSYGGGAERGPDAVLQASLQVDLYDLHYGRAYEAGIHLEVADPRLATLHERARALAAPIIERGGAADEDTEAIAEIDGIGGLVRDITHARVADILRDDRIPAVLGGDHSVPQGAIAAVAERFPGLGILQIDAHADLRVAYEGMRYSHASIMDNVLRESAVARLVQVGIRDFCEQEFAAIAAADGRIVTHFDQEWHRRRACGESFDALCQEAVAALPEDVYISFDIDGLDPALCPNTGTPVPGGLGFAEMSHLLQVVVRSGRRIRGFDLVEVAPGGDEWDANVGARVLYKLCCAAITTRRTS